MISLILNNNIFILSICYQSHFSLRHLNQFKLYTMQMYYSAHEEEFLLTLNSFVKINVRMILSGVLYSSLSTCWYKEKNWNLNLICWCIWVFRRELWSKGYEWYILINKWILVKNYRVLRIQSTEFKKIN